MRPALVLLMSVLSAACSSKKQEPAAKEPAAEPAKGSGEIKVAAASDLAKAFEEIKAAFEQQTGKKVVLSFGSSGQFATQLREGAPFDVFASANVKFVDDVVAAGVCDGSTKAMYARGRIVLWTREGVATAAQLADLTDARFTKIAIANPEHAPYGKAAKEALEASGLWDQVQPKIVYGENIRQTMQFVETGNAEAAVVALALTVGAKGGTATPIDDALHKPLDQALVVCKRGTDTALAADFAKFVNAPEGRAIMNRYGFTLPGEVSATK